MLVLAAYSSVFGAGFIWDDNEYVTANTCIRSLGGLAAAWSEPGATPQYYPMVFTVFFLQFKLWGIAPLGYHLVNIVLHAASAVLLWACLRRLGVPGGFFAACIFAVHPVNVESVAWVTELKNVLSLFFYLLAFLSYLKFLRMADGGVTVGRKLPAAYALALFLFVLALLSKTVAGSMPAAVLIVLWWRDGRIRMKDVLRLMPFFILALILGLHTASVERSLVGAQGADWDFSPLERILIAGRAICFYACKLLVPYPLMFTYPRWEIDAGQWVQYLFPLMAAAAVATLFLLRKRIGRGPSAAALFFLVSLAPALGFFDVYPMRFSFVADHFQYLACIGPITLFGAGIERISKMEFRLSQAVSHAVFSAAVLLSAALAWCHGRVFKDSIVLFSDVVAKNPSSWMGYNNRGAEYFAIRSYDLALADFDRALELKPGFADALVNRGLIYLAMKDFGKALDDLDKAVAAEPKSWDAYSARSMVHRGAGRLDLALADCDKALSLNPSFIKGLIRRGIIYSMMRKHDLALGDLDRAVAADPANFEAYANRGLVCHELGRTEQAMADFNRALSLNPDAPAVLHNRALAYLSMGRNEDALADLLRARKLGFPVPEEEMLKSAGKSNAR